MPEIKVKCPAKINLTLEILNKREDGFHNIQSIMQTIDLFDILTIKVEKKSDFKINLSGTSDEIPYNEKNLVYKAALLFFEKLKSDDKFYVDIHIEKNIPISAGLAGGSTDAAGTVWGLNKMLGNPLDSETLHEICASLGSDLNFCLEGGCQLTTGRGEVLQDLNAGDKFGDIRLTLIKPKKLGISAKEAYTKFSLLEKKPNLNMTQYFIDNMSKDGFKVEKFLHNDLEVALIDDYCELKQIKSAVPSSIMSGSGSTFFVLNSVVDGLDDDFWVKSGLKFLTNGVQEL